VDAYLASIALPSNSFPENPVTPKHQTAVSRSSEMRISLNWFISSPEFEAWDSQKSTFLWLSGIPNSGKTVLSCYLVEYLKNRQTYKAERDVIAFFCSSGPENNRPRIQIEHILGSIASQLLRCEEGRLDIASRQNPLSKFVPKHPPLALPLGPLWKLVRDLITAISDREIVLILDGVDEIRPQETREIFLDGILKLWKHLQSKEQATVKIFVTSRPFSDIQQALTDLPNMEKDKERKGLLPLTKSPLGHPADIFTECLKTLYFREYSARQNRVSEAQESTGSWIEDHSAYKAWDEDPNSSLLWLHGKPGSGKSTLAKRVINSKRTESQKSRQMKNDGASHSNSGPTSYVDISDKDSNVIVAAFFYSFRGGKTETSHTLMLRSLLYQILEQNSTLFPHFRDLYRTLLKTQGPHPEWSHKDLKSSFESLRNIQTQVKMYIIVDAMDESDKDRKPEILSLISTLCSSRSSCIFKGLIASRPELDIKGHLGKCHRITLEEENSQDIKNVIIRDLGRISDLAELREPESELGEVRDYMIEHSHGVFLWVSLVLKELEKQIVNKGFSEANLMNLLKSLPFELGELYKRIVDELVANREKEDVKEGQKSLVWAIFAERPLAIDEFGDSLIIPSGPAKLPLSEVSLRKSRIRLLERRIAYITGGLLEVSKIPLLSFMGKLSYFTDTPWQYCSASAPNY
jgi:GTPase SAR1 family protein